MQTESEGSRFLRHEPCPSCGSRNNLARYSDGHGFCFGCEHYERGDGSVEESKQVKMAGMIESTYQALEKRGLNEETCRVWNYGVGTYLGQPVHVAEYRNSKGEIVAQKIRTADKQFRILGDSSSIVLFGQHRFAPAGRMVIVTEGEIDAMSFSQCWDHKYPVVSVPNGASSAAKAVRRSLDWLEGFDKVVFAFDMDEPGQEAAKECATLLTPGKAHIARLPSKDANDAIREGKAKELIDCVWRATPFRPDCIVAASEIWDKIAEWDGRQGIPYPWEQLNPMTHGIRLGEIVTITAGTGIGKSQFCRELAHALVKRDLSVGYIALEESTARTALGLMSIEVNKRLHLGADKQMLRDAFDRMFADNKVYLYDHFGSTEGQNLLDRIRYMVKGLGCKIIVLDHISIALSGLDEGGDERRMLDNLMTKMRTLVEEVKCALFLVCHLKRVDGRPHEEGGEVRLSHLRSSAGIAQLSDCVIALERNQQSEENRNQTRVRVLKNRFTGETGVAMALEYNQETGRLVPCEMFDPLVEVPSGGDF